MKIYAVNRESTGEYSCSGIVKLFSTKEKAVNYKSELENKYKDDLMFQVKAFYFEIEELEVE